MREVLRLTFNFKRLSKLDGRRTFVTRTIDGNETFGRTP